MIDNAKGEDTILRNKLIAMGKQQGVVPPEGWGKWTATGIRNLLDSFERDAQDVYEFCGDDLTPPVSILFGCRGVLERISDLDVLRQHESEVSSDRPH